MIAVKFWIDVVSTMLTLLASLYIYAKATNITLSASVSHKIYSILWCFLWALFCAYGLPGIPLLLIRALICAVFIVFIRILTKTKFETVISAYLLSYGSSYALLYIAGLFLGLIFAPFMSAGHAEDALFDFNDPISLLIVALTAVVQFLFAHLLFRLKRFKNGFPFLFEKYAVVWALIAVGVVLTLVSLIATPREVYGDSYAFMSFVAGVIIVGAGIVIWVRRGIKLFYRRRMKERGIELLERELAEKEDEIRHLTEQNDALRVESHKINSRLAALERSVAVLAEDAEGHAFSAEKNKRIFVTLENIMCLTQDYQKGIDRVKGKKLLPSAKINMIDDLFGYFSEQCAEHKIDFNLKINGSIPYMTENIVPQPLLETLIGDHLKDALIAVNAGTGSFRSILAALGLNGEHYELSVFDSGVPFSPDTLARLGTERVTTHADAGGSGIGFMTTFETMRRCGASLLINEKDSDGAGFEKSVTIRFDGKNQYIIETYRPDAFPESDRYTIIGP